jgi:hypothetical protein
MAESNDWKRKRLHWAGGAGIISDQFGFGSLSEHKSLRLKPVFPGRMAKPRDSISWSSCGTMPSSLVHPSLGIKMNAKSRETIPKLNKI